MKLRRPVVCAALLAVTVSLAACGGDAPATGGSHSPASAAASSDTRAVSVADIQVSSGATPTISFPPGLSPAQQLSIKVLTPGTGAAVASPTDVVTAHYVGVALSTGQVFDSSYERGEPTSFPLNQVIAGWTQGLQGAQVGSRVLLVIPPALAYGDTPPSAIAPGETLIFVVDVIAVTPGQ